MTRGEKRPARRLVCIDALYIVRFNEISTPLNLDGSYNCTHGNLLKMARGTTFPADICKTGAPYASAGMPAASVKVARTSAWFHLHQTFQTRAF